MGSTNPSVPCLMSWYWTRHRQWQLKAELKALMAKVDVKTPYRDVPIHSHNRWLMGMLWKGSLYIDTALAPVRPAG